MDNARTFGAQAQTYASARPHYPPELYDWIASQSPALDKVWDVGTGSGQAAVSLAKRFSQVYATDIDREQIAHAAEHPHVQYFQAEAHHSALPPSSVDAVTVATALHWFDHKLFWEEVARAAKPGALFCAWTYHRCVTDTDVHEHLIEPVLEIIEPYWAEGNRLSWRGYFPDELGMPFEVINMPEIECHLSWTPTQIAALITSWSAHKKARMDGHEEKLVQIEQKAVRELDDKARPFILPLNTLAARVN